LRNISGNNTYGGTITNTAAARINSDAGTLTLSGAINATNQALTFGGAGDIAVSGAITNSASTLTKDGAGTLTLSGANTYSGGTLVSGGRLIGTTTSLQGSITNNAAATFDQTTNGTYAGTMTGSGSLVKSGAGVVTLSGANSYSGGTLVSAGDLVGTTTSLQGAITNNAAVTFNQAADGTYAGTMSGTGSLTKSGAGSVTLTAANSYAGGTTVNAGTLVAADNTALGSGAVEVNGSTLLADAGVTIANDLTLEAASGSSLVAYWNFNSYTGGAGPIAADSGSGSISLAGWTGTLDDFGGSTINALFGDEAGASLTLINQTGNGSYIQISGLDFTGLTDADISFATRGTSTGFSTGQWSYSTDGVGFTNFGSSTATTSTSFGLAGPGTTTGLDNTGTGFLRYTLSGASDTGGNNRLDNLQINASGVGDPAVVGSEAAGTATFTGGITINNQADFTAGAGGQTVFSGVVGGAGTALEKVGAGTVTLSGASANTFSGTTTVSAGTLQLNKTAGTDALAGDVEVGSGAFLLISQSNQVNNSADVSLSGGTIRRGSGVSEVFGALVLEGNSSLDFGTGATGTLSFTSYTPSALLTVNNFLPGNKLTFASDLSGSIENGALFSFQGAFDWDWDQTTANTFTITAIPEPSTYAAAAGLLSLMLWPSRKRLLKDAMKILGLTPPMRDRLAARREQKMKLEA
jgi:autotransporter-associated beta strand protein